MPQPPPFPKRRPGSVGRILSLSGHFAAGRFKRRWPDPALAAMAAKKSTVPKPHEKDLHKARAEYDKLGLLLGRTDAQVNIEDIKAPGASGALNARRYAPGTDPQGRLIYFPGGGWVLGGLDSHDDFCRFIAAAARVEIISVAYRLAPEHPFPAAAEDAVRAAQSLSDPSYWRRPDTPGFLGGDSAGGNLALVAALANGGARTDGVWLIYPSLDVSDETPLPEEADAKGFGISEETAKWFLEQYVPDPEDRLHPWLRMGLSEKTGNLPRAYLGLAEKDVLRPQGEAYAEKLKALKIPHRHDLLRNLPHAFIHMIGASRAAHDGAARLARGLSWLIDETQRADVTTKP